MNKKITRRQLLATGAAIGAGGFLSSDFKENSPPQWNGLFGASELLTMQVQRRLMTDQTMAREYDKSDISKFFPTAGTIMPEEEAYQNYILDNFASWTLGVEGLVETPLVLSLADLIDMPSRTQITSHSCERGWSFIAEWKGVPLSFLLQKAGLKPEARYVQFECEDYWYDAIDMYDALHAQTILAYQMNGDSLPIEHGAPVRLRVERKMGYKNTKYVKKIKVVDNLDGKGKSFPMDYGVNWFGAI